MKNVWEKWTGISLVKRIVVGLIIGVILALTAPGASGIGVLGNVFVGALKGIAPLLVFFLVMSALSNAGKSHGGVIRTVIILYMFSTVLAAVVAVFASMIFPVQMALTDAAVDAAAPDGIVAVLSTLLMNVVQNPVSSLVDANYVGILSWAVLLGVACVRRNQKDAGRYIDGNFQSGCGDYQSGATRRSGTGVYQRYDQRSGSLYRIWKTIDFAGGLYALYLLCDQPDSCVLVYP